MSERNAKVIRTLTATVVSDTRQKTRKVEVLWAVRHPRYGKVVRRKTVLQVHDEQNVSKTGDVTLIRECRPMSKTKRWEIAEVVKVSKIDKQ